MGLRAFAEEDIPQVVELHWRHMRQDNGPVPPGVESAFRELYFTNPWIESSFPPLVYENSKGKIVGFMGVTVRKMSIRGNPISVSFGGNLIVHPDARSGLATPRLIGAFLAGKQDLLLTDSANEKSRKILERLGCLTVPALNIHWVRPLRPGQFATSIIARATGPLVSATVKPLIKPFGSLADLMAAKFYPRLFGRISPRLKGEDLDVETLLHCMSEFRKGYSLWPEYDLASLRWLLSFMERTRSARGDLRKVVVRDDDQKIVGWYIYYVKPGAVGDVVQIGGDQKSTKDILDHLFWDALEHGVIGLHGVADSRRTPDFSDKGCFFTCRGGWTVARSRNQEILKSLNCGDVFLTRLDGEWCLNPGI